MSFIQSVKDYFARVREYYLGSRLSKEEGRQDSIFPNHLRGESRTTPNELPSSNDNTRVIDIKADVKNVKRLN